MRSCCEQVGISLADDVFLQISRYCDQLAEYNQHTNLVSKSDAETVIRDHICDAIALVPLLRKLDVADGKLIDIGSGAGFPGIILAIVLEKLHATLVDSIGKKTRFLQEAAEALELGARVEVATARAEELGHDARFRESFNIATARAVGTLALTVELAVPLLSIGGYFLAQKSARQADEELTAAREAMKLLGAELVSNDPSARGEKNHVIIAVKKVAPTPAKFPRASAQLKKPIK